MSSFPHPHLTFFFDILVFLLIFWGVPHLLSGPDPSLPLLSGVAEVAEMVAGGHKPPQQEDTKLDQHLFKNEVTLKTFKQRPLYANTNFLG